MRLIILVLCLLSLCAPLLAKTAPTEDDLKLTRLENQTHARDLYLAGEAASKKGDLQTAIWDWAQALALKPDSAYTAKCLTDARQKVYKQYIAEMSEKSDAKDPLTALVKLNSILPLLPDKQDLVARATKLKDSLTDDQKKALLACQSGSNFMSVGDYTGAAQSFATAQSLARGSACIEDSLKQLDGLIRAHAGRVAQVSFSSSPGSPSPPKMVYIYVTWCHWCTKMDPVIEEIKAKYGPKLSVVSIDGDQDRSAVRHYGVSMYPTTIFLDSRGSEVDRGSGYGTKDDVMSSLAKLGL
jgi:thiol-disulfide isomerase/thioredoxin